MHMEGEKLDNYIGENFPDLWKKYEVLGTGWIEIERMALFYKELMGDWKVALQ